jgi:metal-responsive CopG/Arc/MetJ family transcriptional regulator
MPSKKPFLSFVIEEDLLKNIDDYRFKNHFESRASAIKYLIEYALKDLKEKH